jgi:predicted acyltransferase (DUF342 family)
VRAEAIVIGDRGKVKGPLIGDTVEIGERSEVEEVYGKRIIIEDRSRVEQIHGVDVEIEEGCRILGEVLYSGSLDAEEGVSFAVEPKKVDSLPSPPS